MTPRRHRGARAAAALAVLAALTACEMRAQQADVFVTREGSIALEPAPTRSGETILDVENDDDAEHQLVLVRLEDGREPDELPLGSDGTIAVGRPIDLDFRGDGYQVVEKLDRMRAYFGGEFRVTTSIHTYLRPGTHVLLCNLPGHYEDGTYVAFDVEERA